MMSNTSINFGYGIASEEIGFGFTRHYRASQLALLQAATVSGTHLSVHRLGKEDG